ncbi:uncharacterized protein BDCG_06733 [Blastomyces dermatitidis ER-3]|uniref:Integral membrane protein n=1 Tax=Ajellomyces dermatitidis (strain ER-3 / ATCC MYA-2586) TaxID=559297 RepID=A0ABX2VY61_AJEDR|nr:uncharacterized protein BDCG_06733 [Blastomyces dermatitidis ER-3]OAT02085.1 hypothetical protein BDCG_06733 [Blastomyces dermatitidis ER-3]
MSLPAIFKTTVQAAVLNGSSNVIAQAITAYRHGATFALDYIELIRFIICTLITTPFMVLWQDYLEATFPASPQDNARRIPAEMEGNSERTSNSNTTAKEVPHGGVQTNQPERKETQEPIQEKNTWNTISKILIDQTVGAGWSTALFIVTISALNGQDANAIQQSLFRDFVPIIIAGLKLWPMVSVISFTMVPPEKRVLTGNLFGMIWGIYLSLRTEE